MQSKSGAPPATEGPREVATEPYLRETEDVSSSLSPRDAWWVATGRVPAAWAGEAQLPGGPQHTRQPTVLEGLLPPQPRRPSETHSAEAAATLHVLLCSGDIMVGR